MILSESEIYEKFPRVLFTDLGKERLAEIVKFLRDDLADHARHDNIEEGFLSTMAYLNEYGGPVSDDDPRRRFRITLGYDWAPYSFSVVWERLLPAPQFKMECLSCRHKWLTGVTEEPVPCPACSKGVRFTISLGETEYQHSLSGGMIWHGGSNDPLTIHVGEFQWWGLHT